MLIPLFRRYLPRSVAVIKMYTVYVLYSDLDDKFYIGFTSNLKRRLSEHKAKKNHTTLRYDDLN